ncbi:Hypothetical protein Ccan_19560 [Capnocytophaga canimorsus Cc5]|uniref:Uncharacterized protein n=1 Tax=Capnocytophaga canimorsus (strain 5) TaxID=860228 RepID=F9YTM7_CAPCC|nr:Hypothetical protein Ccan_19560 [Capnocytophaga canimorsus Cc5]
MINKIIKINMLRFYFCILLLFLALFVLEKIFLKIKKYRIIFCLI